MSHGMKYCGCLLSVTDWKCLCMAYKSLYGEMTVIKEERSRSVSNLLDGSSAVR